METFNIDSYVFDRLKHDGIDNEDSRISLYKQVVNILKYFSFRGDVKLCSSTKSKKLGYHVFSYFPFWNLTEEHQCKFMDLLFDKKKDESSKFVSNVNKIYIDNRRIEINNYMQDSRYRSFNKEFLINEINSHNETICNNIMYACRNVIRQGDFFSTELEHGIITALNILRKEHLYFNLSKAMHLVADICLQILNYWVFTIKGFADNYIDGITSILNEHMELSLQKTYSRLLFYNKNINKINYDDAIGIFAAFLERRNDFCQYTEIIHVLMKEVICEPENFITSADKYKVTKDMFLPSNVEDVLTEGQSIDNFNKKLENTKLLIDIFSKYGVRNASADKIMDLKVYFREFYISNSGYKNQAQTIVRKYIEKYHECNEIDSFEKLSEYQFLREKVNRGYFRETSGLLKYNQKNEIQEELYNNLLWMFLLYDYNLFFDYLSEFILEYINVCRVYIKPLVLKI